MDDVHLSTACHFRYELRLRLGGKFSATIWSAGGVPRITRRALDNVNGEASQAGIVGLILYPTVILRAFPTRATRLSSLGEISKLSKSY